MLPDVPANSISSNPRMAVSLVARAIMISWRIKTKERLAWSGLGGALLIWVVFPAFPLIMAGLIYRTARPDLVGYTVVAFSANTFIFTMLFYVGTLLDAERANGSLVSLFLAPCPRAAWLLGFALAGLLDTAISATVVALFGTWSFGVRFDPDYPALLLTFTLFLVALWGLGFILSGIGLALKNSGDLANLLFPVIILLGGVWIPVALLPTWLRYPARCLPVGYGMQALADAALHHASIPSLAPQLLPLAGFAVVLPFAGIRTFAELERLVRERGELDLY